MDPRLVFDIGLSNGDDSRYYLDLGYSVVGVEANPLRVDECKLRFEKEIEQGRMKVVNLGVLKQPGSFTFYRNLVMDDRSSFVQRDGNQEDWEEIEIRCVTTRDLIDEHGTPYFMKVDIEGADLQALATLPLSNCPPYVSLELGSTGEEILNRLIELSYTAFKFIDGESHWHTRRILNDEYGWRLLRKLSRSAPFIRTTISSLPQSLRNRGEWNPTEIYNPDSYAFGPLSSGPFGERAAGSWKTMNASRAFLRDLQEYARKVGRGNWIWWDVHARHGSVSGR
ncbi:MAG: FkbM family methyltransferase [Terracidiphilus sp.]